MDSSQTQNINKNYSNQQNKINESLQEDEEENKSIIKTTENKPIINNNNNQNFIQLPDLNSLCCYICTDFYTHEKKPLILVCGHTFCEGCLSALFDSCKEIQCSFCKIITKLEKFDDMIVNYSMLSLCEIIQEKNKDNINLNLNNCNLNNENNNNNLNTSILIPAFKAYDKFNLANNNQYFFGINNNSASNNKSKQCEMCTKFSNVSEIDKLLECQECEIITCKDCFYIHKNHKLTNIVDFIEAKSESLLKACNGYKDLSAKMAALHKKMDKSELEKLVRVEKEKLNAHFREVKNLLEKNQEIILHTMDKLLTDYINSIDEFKKNVKIFNSDSQRYYNVITEFSSFHKIENKERQKILRLFNFNQFCNEIKQFNGSVADKLSSLISSEVFFKDFLNKLKNVVAYKNKILKIAKLANEKATRGLSSDNKVYFFKSFKRI
jgi:hypothetical protein